MRVFKNIFVVLGVLCAVSPAFAETLFSENWEAGINEEAWVLAGTPLPVLYSPGHESDTALDMNGDATCDSGAYTVTEFSTEQDLSAEFWLKGRATGTTGMSINAGFTDGNAPTGTCSAEGYFGTLASITMTSSTLGKGILYTAGIEAFFEAYPGDEWHLFKIALLPDGVVKFYRDGELKFAPETTVDLSAYPVTRFQVKGKATSAVDPMLIDDIVLSSEGNTCYPDVNGDQIVDINDLKDKAQIEMTEFVTWVATCYTTGLPCGDYNQDEVIDSQDQIDKAKDMIIAFVQWTMECWMPNAKLPARRAMKVVNEALQELSNALLDVSQPVNLLRYE